MVKLSPTTFAKHARFFALAEHRRDTVEQVKAAVAASGTDDAIYRTDHSTAFAAAVRARSILGRLAGVVDVPIATTLPFLSAGAAAGFHGEMMHISVSAAALGNPATLFPHKVSGLVVVTEELLRHSQAEAILQRDMTAALTGAIDARMFDPAASTDSDNDGPASITSGAVPIDAAAVIDADGMDWLIAAMVAELIAAGSTLEYAAWITTPSVALALSLLRTEGHQRAYPGVSVIGGTLEGLPLLVSASATGLTLVDGSDLLVGDRNRAAIGFSRETTIDMDSEPDGSRRVSLYQTESIALKVSREISWRMRDGFVSFAEGLDLPLPTMPS
jgi:HK97 family phage major capsid protein